MRFARRRLPSFLPLTSSFYPNIPQRQVNPVTPLAFPKAPLPSCRCPFLSSPSRGDQPRRPPTPALHLRPPPCSTYTTSTPPRPHAASPDTHTLVPVPANGRSPLPSRNDSRIACTARWRGGAWELQVSTSRKGLATRRSGCRLVGRRPEEEGGRGRRTDDLGRSFTDLGYEVWGGRSGLRDWALGIGGGRGSAATPRREGREGARVGRSAEGVRWVAWELACYAGGAIRHTARCTPSSSAVFPPCAHGRRPRTATRVEEDMRSTTSRMEYNECNVVAVDNTMRCDA